MTRVLILGGAGMLGHKAYQVLGKHFEVHATVQRFDDRLAATGIFDRRRILPEVQAWDMDSVRRALSQTRPEWVVNCIGIIKQREQAHDPTQAIYVNALFPHFLAEACRQVGARLLHISTDCVFSGRRGSYRETDPSDAEDLYGRTKYLGEVTEPGCLTIRTSIIGRDLFADLSLVDWFLAQSGRRVRGYARAIYSGLTTTALSCEVCAIIAGHSELEGLYHISSSPITKYDLLGMLNDVYRAGIAIDRDEAEVSDRSLVSDRYWRATRRQEPSWRQMIVELAADPTNYFGFRNLKA